MSRDITVLTPNGRRLKVHCTPDTSILQVLEDVCTKQGISPTNYDLKHHNTILDLSTTIRFSNLPNKATLEMVEVERQRLETNITIGLLLDDGDRKTGDFSPNTSLYDLITLLAPNALNVLQQPSILYMRQEVTGLHALKEKTLRQLGLLSGRAILRLLNKAEAPSQANVSAVYRRPVNEKNDFGNKNQIGEKEIKSNSTASTSHIIQESKTVDSSVQNILNQEKELNFFQEKDEDLSKTCETPSVSHIQHPFKSETSVASQGQFERRLKIEEEVTFIGAQKAIAFMQPQGTEEEIDDLPDDFYDLTIEEVRRLYHDLQQQRADLDNSPLISTKKRIEDDKQSLIEKTQKYQNVVVRIKFPDLIILQGVFNPNNTIEDIIDFTKEHLEHPHKQFHIFTTPLKECLNPKMTLLEANFVPCVLMHFKWSNDDSSTEFFLKKEIYAKKTPSDAAGILASKYRAPSRRKREETPSCSQNNVTNTSSSKNSKVPKWFKK